MQSWRFSGFGTLGLAEVQAPEGWGYRRDVSQPQRLSRLRTDVDSRLGLQANLQATSQIELVGQLLARPMAPNATPGDRLEWAFLAWRPDPDTRLRLGRINPDLFLLSAYRDVGFAQPAVRPPGGQRQDHLAHRCGAVA